MENKQVNKTMDGNEGNNGEKRCFSAVSHYPTAVSTSVQEKKQSQLLDVVADTLMGVQRGKQVKVRSQRESQCPLFLTAAPTCLLHL